MEIMIASFSLPWNPSTVLTWWGKRRDPRDTSALEYAKDRLLCERLGGDSVAGVAS